MAAGDWADGTKAQLLDATVSFDGTASNTPTSVRIGYRMVLKSGEVLPDLRTANLSPPDANAMTALEPALAAMYQLVAGLEGIE
jgi:hypothetical protein